MSHIRCLWVCLGYLIIFVDFIQPDRMNVCPRRQVVSYTRNVNKSRSLPYQQYSFWSGWQTKYRTEYYTQNEIAHKTEVREICCDGYEGSIPNCQPVCREKCPAHGFCSSPNTCSCHTGYGGSDCQPICPAGCGKNEICDQPGVCSCQNGYNRTSSSDNCLPVCREECGHHSFCSEPGKCKCEPGYEKMESGTACHAICSPKCGENARCTSPGTCSCDPGYRFQNNSHHVCDPICDSGCSNGDCVAPNICICHDGYQPNNTNPVTSMCQPVCESQTTTDSNEYSTTSEDFQTSTADLHPYSEAEAVSERTESSQKWMIIMGSCAGMILCVAVAIFGTKYYRRSISRQNDEAEPVMYKCDLE
ncbi:multiple epidermal growth factor-like domains protein 10 [Drosophila yakuba]|uniref:EMI domain-containing protein n=1 Tax=Drosophila yakuba TaxID=7245 RepID=B4P0H3_DROYA|nr:multiple epidermal growth factor-like domains protein 10 [Drosophila yakuba]EDW88967.2 uncharacterized protein Dyak_GE25214 [Drosophila yakuba]